MRFHKKGLIAVGLALALGACSSGTSTGGVTPAQAVTIAQQTVTAVRAEVAAVKPMLDAQQQAVADKADALLADAQNAVASLNTSMTATAAAPVLQQIETDLNAVVAVVATVPMPPPYNAVAAGLAISLPIIEGFVNSVVPVAPATQAAK